LIRLCVRKQTSVSYYAAFVDVTKSGVCMSQFMRTPSPKKASIIALVYSN